MTDAIFYTAYDDMPPIVRLRRTRRSRRGSALVAPPWLLAAGLSLMSGLPALGPGHSHAPSSPSRAPSKLEAAAALPTPPRIATGPLLQAAFLAGTPIGFGGTSPLPTRFVPPGAPVILATAEAAAPGPRADTQPSAVEASVAGPQVATAAEAEDGDEAILPPVRALPLVVAAVPTPMPRPSDLAPTVTRLPPFRADRRQASPSRTAPAAPIVSADNRGFLEKFFGMGQGANASAPPALGYAAPEDGFFSGLRGASNPTRGYGSATAVYEIATHTVFMPDGSRLEAHSGLGPRLDDARFVHERMRGPTPPATYALTLRESLFHGVQALRLNPIDSGVYGRNGLLAHTYMLGPKGDSNGCVSFRNYKAFLQAFQNGDIKRLVVVARLS